MKEDNPQWSEWSNDERYLRCPVSDRMILRIFVFQPFGETTWTYEIFDRDDGDECCLESVGDFPTRDAVQEAAMKAARKFWTTEGHGE